MYILTIIAVMVGGGLYFDETHDETKSIINGSIDRAKKVSKDIVKKAKKTIAEKVGE